MFFGFLKAERHVVNHARVGVDKQSGAKCFPAPYKELGFFRFTGQLKNKPDGLNMTSADRSRRRRIGDDKNRIVGKPALADARRHALNQSAPQAKKTMARLLLTKALLFMRQQRVQSADLGDRGFTGEVFTNVRRRFFVDR